MQGLHHVIAPSLPLGLLFGAAFCGRSENTLRKIHRRFVTTSDGVEKPPDFVTSCFAAGAEAEAILTKHVRKF